MAEGDKHKTIRLIAGKILERAGGKPHYTDREIDISAFGGKMRIEVQTNGNRRDLLADLYGRPTLFLVPDDAKERVIFALRKILQGYNKPLRIPVVGISEFGKYLEIILKNNRLHVLNTNKPILLDIEH